MQRLEHLGPTGREPAPAAVREGDPGERVTDKRDRNSGTDDQSQEDRVQSLANAP